MEFLINSLKKISSHDYLNMHEYFIIPKIEMFII